MRRSTSTRPSTGTESTDPAAATDVPAPERGVGTRYGVVLALLAGAVIAAIVGAPSHYAGLLAAALEGAAAVVVLGGGVTHRWVRTAIVLILVASLVSRLLTTGGPQQALLNLLSIALIATIPIVTAVRFRRNPVVNLQAVLGAVSIYLVLGIAFAQADAAYGDFTGGAFFAGGGSTRLSDYEYFSFITLTTVGYGDLVPSGGLPRSLAVVEALTGQLYLVTVVALLVSNFGASRSEPSKAPTEPNHLSSAAGAAKEGEREPS